MYRIFDDQLTIWSRANLDLIRQTIQSLQKILCCSCSYNTNQYFMGQFYADLQHLTESGIESEMTERKLRNVTLAMHVMQSISFIFQWRRSLSLALVVT